MKRVLRNLCFRYGNKGRYGNMIDSLDSDKKWLDISPLLLMIFDRASALGTVEYIGQAIDHCRSVLDGQEDRHGTLKSLFKHSQCNC